MTVQVRVTSRSVEDMQTAPDPWLCIVFSINKRAFCTFFPHFYLSFCCLGRRADSVGIELELRIMRLH